MMTIIFNDNTGGIDFWESIGWAYRRDVGVVSKIIEKLSKKCILRPMAALPRIAGFSIDLIVLRCITLRFKMLTLKQVAR